MRDVWCNVDSELACIRVVTEHFDSKIWASVFEPSKPTPIFLISLDILVPCAKYGQKSIHHDITTNTALIEVLITISYRNHFCEGQFIRHTRFNLEIMGARSSVKVECMSSLMIPYRSFCYEFLASHFSASSFIRSKKFFSAWSRGKSIWYKIAEPSLQSVTFVPIFVIPSFAWLLCEMLVLIGATKSRQNKPCAKNSDWHGNRF